MSRGPGRIERAIRELFDAHPDLAFVIDELCERCYPNAAGQIERKHQVAVLRAAWAVIEDDPDWRAWRIAGMGRGWVFVNEANVQSFTEGETIAGGRWSANDVIYRSPGRAKRKPSKWLRAGPGFRRILHEPRIHATDRAELLHYTPAPRAAVIREVTDHIAWRDGDASVRASIAARRAIEHEAWLAEGKRLADLIRGKSYEATDDVGNETLSPQAFADRIRALMTQNDPDVVRAGLAEIADALDILGRRKAPMLDAAAD
jgi:hypothetical protein